MFTNNKLNELIALLKAESRLLLSISFGIYLFILFFQPFPIHSFDLNYNLIFVAGLAGIVFLFMLIIRIVLPLSFKIRKDKENLIIFPQYAGSFLMLVLSSLAFAFYLHYVGSIEISFHLMFKVVLICLAPPVILRYYDVDKELKEYNKALIIEKRNLQKQIEKFEEDFLNKTIEFISENKSENLALPIRDILLISSADNYAEIIFKEGDILRKKLIRNTLKNIEQQLKPYSHFIRCHRAYIINILFIERLEKNLSNYFVVLKDYDGQIPVSRQYLLVVREHI